MLEAVFRNLISNAIKYTRNGGRVRVEAQVRGDFVEVAIIDNGVGMSEERLENLFNVGEKRTSTFGTAGEKGTGLGLILCKEFVEKQGGQIWVESEEDQGSTFKFTVPVSR
jgi:signal transduction histidine kinase